MNEAFVHYIWQYQYFKKEGLTTTSGEAVHVFSPGVRNSDAGPDFLNAKLKLGDMQWVGSVEIHINASGWTLHGHDDDDAYSNVILHVVWNDDKPVSRPDGSPLPTLELRPRVDENLFFRYKRLVGSADDIACSYALPEIRPVVLLGALDRVSAGRLENRARDVLAVLARNRGDWDETTYQLLCRNFGFKVNAEPFLQLSLAVPLKILGRHRDRSVQVEALLFGVAGFLDETDLDDEYYLLLRREFNLLRQKYRLDGRMMNRVQWRYLRLRPANFPTLRIAQLAAVVCNGQNLFRDILERDYAGVRALLQVAPAVYWQTHYNFQRKSTAREGLAGSASVDNVIINTVVPVLAAVSLVRDDNRYLERALRILHELPGEDNKVTRRWAAFSVASKSAFDSQALLELYNGFCSRHRCLECNIGASLLKPLRA